MSVKFNKRIATVLGLSPDHLFLPSRTTFNSQGLRWCSQPAAELNQMAVICRALNDRWWRNPKTGKRIKRNRLALLMLAVTELAEAAEGERKDVMDTHLPHRKMVEVELADCLIRILDYAAGFNLDIGGAFVEKLQYNWTRADHSNDARLRKGGKKC